MGDWFDHYVARALEVPDVIEQAERLTSWLLDNELIEPGLTAAPLGGEGYRPGRRALEAIANPSDIYALTTNGVRIVTERTVFFAFDTSEARCPHCNAEVSSETWEAAIGPWFAGEGPGEVACSECHTQVVLCDLVMDDPWGFSNFGITFWNWGALDEQWEQRLSTVMGQPLTHVCGKL